jgi:uracil phosphoribosyltransferase
MIDGMAVEVTIVDHPVAAEALTHLRDENTTNQFFRAELRRLSLVVVAEASRHLPTIKTRVRTPLAETDGIALASRPVLVPILRAGLGMLPAAMELLPDADIAVVGVQRDEKTHEPSEYVAKLPSRLDGRTCLVLDPMLATGGSLAHGTSSQHRLIVTSMRMLLSCPALAMLATVNSVPRTENLAKKSFCDVGKKLQINRASLTRSDRHVGGFNLSGFEHNHLAKLFVVHGIDCR